MTAKKVIKYLCVFLVAPLIVLCGVFFLGDRKYAFVSLALSVVACIPFFVSFEKGKNDARRIVIIAVMTALSVAGRFVFAPIPFFKPVTAIVIITAIYLGAEAGFITGAFSAVVSNFYFGQGPWTPFQMFAWGLIGFLAGLLAKRLVESKVLLIIFGALSGVVFSFIMDVWTTLWADGTFNIARFIASITTAAPFTVVYMVSNVIFLLLLTKPIGRKLQRLKTKYGIF
ncbi:ECF transporter S component [uncultured Ruminococcus sp.]|uniref:ECF transporter S component n=1 Tax=uncultured Ruminococcus sp. TaxID=165186 RepID=UPI0025ECD494|nr:ECF transporter S component [uncultured Ruminococcus sp.]